MLPKLAFVFLAFLLVVVPLSVAADYKVSVTSAGDGHVSSYPPGILCGAACVESFSAGREITLTANPSAGATFAGWSGDCSGTGASCAFVLDSDKTVKASFSGVGGSAVKLRLTKQGDGIGSVFSSPDGIECSSICGSDSYGFAIDSAVKLTATSKADSKFAGWGGDCSGSDNICILKMDAAKSVTAAFTALAPAPLPSYDLVVAKLGNGTGSVTSGDGKINCGSGSGSDCSESYNSGSSVALKAAADEGSVFTGWGGDCKGDSACALTMDSAKKVTASFSRKPPVQKQAQPLPQQQNAYEGKIISREASQQKPAAPPPPKPKVNYKLNLVKKGGNAYLRITQPESYACSETCAPELTEGSQVTIIYELGAKTKFTGWSGACSGMEKACTVLMDGNKAVSASFVIEEPDVTLHVFKSISTGRIESFPPGASCPENCPGASSKFKLGTVVTLTATPPKGFYFSRWEGQCDSTKGNECTMKLDAPQESAAALFYQSYDTLAVEKAGGAGAGTVSSADGKFNCGPSCSGQYYQYKSGTAVTLTAKPSENSVFDGWSGNCSGAGPCTLTMDGRRSVYASFSGKAPDKFKLGLSIQGSSGLITSADGNIACKTICVEEYPKDSKVVLNAMTDANSEFVGWNGACLGSTQSCSVPITGDKAVYAVFRDKPKEPPKVYKQLYVTPPGWGSVTSSDGKISCGSACGGHYRDYLKDTKVILTATPLPGYVLREWKGDCSGNSTTCALTMDSNKAIGTVFVPEPPKSHRLIVYKLPGKLSDPDMVTSNEGSISCGAACSVDIPTGKKIVLEAKPSVGRALASWGLDCQHAANSQKCEFIMDRPRTVSAAFTVAEAVVTKRNIAASIAGSGAGKVVSEDYRIVCPPVCSALYDSDKKVAFHYENGPESEWLRWEGQCDYADNLPNGYCAVPKSADSQSVTGVFIRLNKLNIKLSNFDSSTLDYIRLDSLGVRKTCFHECSANIRGDYKVKLSASGRTSKGKYAFKGWAYGAGGCAGTARSCELVLSGPTTVHAVFASPGSNVVMVSKDGDGSGKVYSALNNFVDCGSDCSEAYPAGSSFNLLAVPDIGSQFSGWKGDCSGTGPCVVDDSKFVTASFEKAPPRKLVVKKSGEGDKWLISSHDGKVSCSALECTYEFPNGAEVTLAVSNLPVRHRLKGWAGCGAATATCQLKMDSDKSVGIVVEKVTPPRGGGFSCRGRPGCTTPVFG